MNKKYRNIFFLAMVGIFLVSTATILFFETGHRFDLNNKKIVYVGSMTVRTDPKGAEIFLNGEKQKYTTPAVINNLVPGEYMLEIKKNGYINWGKNIEVKQQHATIVNNVLLFKSNEKGDVIEKNLSVHVQSEDKTDLIFTKENDTSTQLLKINTSNGKIEKLGDSTEKILDAKGLDVNNIILTKEKESTPFWVWKAGEKTLTLDDFKNIQKVEMNPKNEKNIFINDENNLWSATRENEALHIEKIDENIISFNIINNEITYLKNQDGNIALNIMNLDGSEKQSFKTNFSVEQIEILRGPKEKIFLKDINKELYFFNRKTESFEKLNIHAEKITLHGKDDGFIAWNNNEAWFISIDKDDHFEKKIIVRQTKKIQDIIWYPESSYILKNDASGIAVINTEETGIETSMYPSPAQNMYMTDTNTLYIIDEQNNLAKMDIR